MKRAINRLILTGYHGSGKSTFINLLCLDNHKINVCRFDILNMFEPWYFSYNMYLSNFNVYDRFIPFDLLIHNKNMDEKLLERVVKKLRKTLRHDYFVIYLRQFTNSENSDYLKANYKKLIDLFDKYRYYYLVVDDNTSTDELYKKIFDNHYFDWFVFDDLQDDHLSDFIHEYLNIQCITDIDNYTIDFFDRYWLDYDEFLFDNTDFNDYVYKHTKISRNPNYCTKEEYIQKIEDYFIQKDDWFYL